MPRLLPLLVVLLLAAPAARAEELLVFAASSLADALEELGREFTRQTGQPVAFNLAGSSDLARQIRKGAPADLFFSADPLQMDVVEQAGLVRPEQRVEVLSNVLVVVAPLDSGLLVRTAADLRRVPRLALADPEAVPAGVYARQWLEGRGLWADLRGRVVPALNVRAALAAVESGAVEAGIVYRTDAALSRRVKVLLEVPAGEGPKIRYVLAPLTTAQGPAAALLRFLISPEAVRVYGRHGFLPLLSVP